MPRVAAKGLALFEGEAGKVYGVDVELLDDSTIRVVKGAKVLVDADEIAKGTGQKADAIHPWIRSAVAKAKGEVTKAASGNRGAGEVDSLMLNPERGIHDPRFVPNNEESFRTPTGLPNSSARLPNGQAPIYAEIDVGGELQRMSIERRVDEARRRHGR
jgi:hypothetical protein